MFPATTSPQWKRPRWNHAAMGTEVSAHCAQKERHRWPSHAWVFSLELVYSWKTQGKEDIISNPSPSTYAGKKVPECVCSGPLVSTWLEQKKTLALSLLHNPPGSTFAFANC